LLSFNIENVSIKFESTLFFSEFFFFSFFPHQNIFLPSKNLRFREEFYSIMTSQTKEKQQAQIRNIFACKNQKFFKRLGL